MSRRASGVPQTPVHNDDALERSLRRQQSSIRGHASISDVARRVQDSPLHREPGRHSRQPSGSFASSPMGSRSSQVAPGDFQEWMKMVRMKRVKANNAFAIQLIDAFHSMVQGEILSSDGQNVTFQEATHTLGGCLTVYKNRIARVKDDTSKLLVGVSEKKAADHDRDEQDASDDDDNDMDSSDEAGENANRKKSRRRAKADAGEDAFLAPSHKLEIDVSELATTIDPLLRKMSADFDKRGAGALLQYSLKVDSQGRLLLDTEAEEVDDAERIPESSNVEPRVASASSLPKIEEEDEEEEEETAEQETGQPDEEQDNDTNTSMSSSPEDDGHASGDTTADELELARFNVAYFANADLSHKEALPLVDSIARAVANPEAGTEELVRDLQAWALVDPANDASYHYEDIRDDVENEYDENNFEEGFDEHMDLGGLGVDLNGLATEMEYDDPALDDAPGGGDQSSNLSINSIVSSRLPASGNWMDIEYLQKLDTQKTNWAGPSFWKVRRLHAREQEQSKSATDGDGTNTGPARVHRNVSHAPTVIDFSQEEEVNIEELFAPGTKSTLLSSKQYDLTNKHLLPVDMHVTTKQLVGLQLRPKTGLAPAFRRGAWRSSLDEGGDMTSMDQSNLHESLEPGMESINAGHAGNDDDYFYGGWDDFGGDGSFRPSTASAMFTQNTQTGYGAQNNQLNFSRVAKRVDVRKLKDNVWKAIQREENVPEPSTPTSSPKAAPPSPMENAQKPATLLRVIHDTQPLYSDQQRADLSPAMYFISLLHLSNEKGLSLENTESLTDIRILSQPA